MGGVEVGVVKEGAMEDGRSGPHMVNTLVATVAMVVGTVLMGGMATPLPTEAPLVVGLTDPLDMIREVRNRSLLMKICTLKIIKFVLYVGQISN